MISITGGTIIIINSTILILKLILIKMKILTRIMKILALETLGSHKMNRILLISYWDKKENKNNKGKITTLTLNMLIIYKWIIKHKYQEETHNLTHSMLHKFQLMKLWLQTI